MSGADPPPAAMERHAFLVRSSREAEVVTRFASRATRAVEEKGWALTEIRMERARLRDASRSRPIDLVPRSDARGLYERLHRARVLVLAFGSASVRRDPSRDPAVKSSVLTLERFVAHKALYGFVRDPPDVALHLARFDRWCTVQGCRSQDDPRIIPLHVFASSDDWSTLGDPATDKQFAQRFGRTRALRDEQGRHWTRDPSRHGMSTLTVAGCTLPRGTHWDVESGGGVTRLCTSNGIWEIRRAGAHVNIYPDAAVRKSGRDSGVRKVWPP